MLQAHHFNSVHNVPRASKRAMVDLLHDVPTKSKMVARNTLDYTMPDGVRRIRLHETDILTFFPDGAIIVHTGGWNTLTTRARINQFLPDPYSVYTDKGAIYLRDRESARSVPFQQWVRIGAHGSLMADMDEATLRYDKRLIDAFMRHVRKRGLPTFEESRGDPWLLHDGAKTEASLMRDWLTEKYFTFRLYELAMQYCGSTPMLIQMIAQTAWANGGKLEKTAVGRVRRYIRASLGYAV